jgi:ceramide glucosyltransferase
VTGDVLEVAAYAGLAWAVAVASVSIEAARRHFWPGLRARIFGASAAPGAASGPTPASARVSAPVLLVRPCAGAEPLLERALVSLEQARFSFPLRCCFAVADESDAALPAARRACSILKLAGIDAHIVLTNAKGPNRKAAQLAAVVERESSELTGGAVIVADSDVDLTGADLDQLIQPLLQSSRADLLWAPPVERASQTRADRASVAVLGGSLHAFPLLAGLDRRGAVGKLFAVRLDALAAAGGFGSLTAVLGEDVELARRIRARGGNVEAAPFAALSLARGRSWDQVVSRYARWLTMVRAQRPLLLLSYPGLFFATPLLVAMSGLVAMAAPSIALASALTAILARLLVGACASHAAHRPVRLASLVADAVLADLVLALAFVRAVRSRKIIWRSTALTVDRSGALRESAA